MVKCQSPFGRGAVPSTGLFLDHQQFQQLRSEVCDFLDELLGREVARLLRLTACSFMSVVDNPRDSDQSLRNDA